MRYKITPTRPNTTAVCSLGGGPQEFAFRQYRHAAGDAPPTGEALFYMHFFGLPLFFLSGRGAASALLAHVSSWCADAARALPLLALNVGACTVCKRWFFALLDESSALTATLAISVRGLVTVVGAVRLASLAATVTRPPESHSECAITSDEGRANERKDERSDATTSPMTRPSSGQYRPYGSPVVRTTPTIMSARLGST